MTLTQTGSVVTKVEVKVKLKLELVNGFFSSNYSCEFSINKLLVGYGSSSANFSSGMVSVGANFSLSCSSEVFGSVVGCTLE